MRSTTAAAPGATSSCADASALTEAGRHGDGGLQRRLRLAGGSRRHEGRREVLGGEHHHLVAGRQRAQLEGQLDDHAERPQRAAEQLWQVVAADVLDDASPAFDRRAVGADHVHPDQPVARVAERGPPQPSATDRDHTADGRLFEAAVVERHKLPVRRQRSLQVRERHPSPDGDREVVRLIVDDSAEPCQIKRDVVSLGRHPKLGERGAADRRDGEVVF